MAQAELEGAAEEGGGPEPVAQAEAEREAPVAGVESEPAQEATSGVESAPLGASDPPMQAEAPAQGPASEEELPDA